MGWIYTVVAAGGELLMIIGIKQQRRAMMVALLLASAVITGYFLNRAFQQIDSSSVYPVWVSLGSLGSLILGYFVYGEKLSRAQLGWIALLLSGCIGLFVADSL